MDSTDVGGTTKILVRGSSTPTFTVYKLERPARVVVDIASSKMSSRLAADDGKATWRVNSWAVGDVAMHPLAGAGASVTRVVVDLARPATYKVKAQGNDVLVIVTPRDPPPKRANGSADVARARAETAAARARAQAAQRSAAAAQAETAAARADAQRARRAASKAERHAAAEKARALEAQRAIAAAKAKAERARAEMAVAKQRADKQVARARAEASSAMADSKKRAAEAEARMAAAAKRVDEANRRLAEVSALERRAKRAESTARAALEEASDARSSATAAQKLAEARRAAAGKAAAAANRYRAEASNAKTDSKKARALEQRAAAAAREAEARRKRAEQATAEAEARRAAAEKAAAEAEQRKTAATAAATAAEAERGKVEHARAIAERERNHAEAEHAEAEKRRQLAERAAAEATRRAAAARSLREKEEAAYHKAATARAEAEKRRAAAEAASARLSKSIDAARVAQSAVVTRRKQAAAAREHADAEKRRARSSRAAAAAEAEAARLEKLVAGADKELAARKAEVDQRRRAAAHLDARRDAAARDLKQLVAAASSARDDRQAEEARLADLLHRRADEEKQLEAARKARLEAEKSAAAAQRRAKDAEDRAATAAAAAAKAKAATARAKAATARVKAAIARAKADAAKARAATAKATPATRVRGVRFSEHGDADRVTISLSAPAHPVVSARGNKQILELSNAAIARDLERTLDTRKYGGPVRAVSSYRSRKDPKKVLVVVDLTAKAKSRLVRVGNDYQWEFHGSHSRVAAARRRAPRAHAQNIPAPVIGGYGSSSTPVAQQTVAQIAPRGRKVYRGTKIDLDFKDADIHNLLRLLADVGGVSIVIPDEIKYRVTVRMRRVPWDQALEVILASKGLWYERNGNLLRIAPRKDLDAEAQAEAERRAAQIQQEVPQPQYVTLNYASAKRVEPQIKQMLSPKGQLQIDERTNTVVVIDVKANRKNIASLLTRLDTPTPQIQIEARIVEARSTFEREIGVQWGGNATASGATGNSTGLIFPNSVGVTGAGDDNQTISTGVVAPSDFAVNLPAAVGSGAGGAIGLSLGSVGGNFNLNLRLSALEDQGTVRIVSAPKITVVNNVKAKISSGVSIPISVISANGVNTQFVPADLSLEVTPSVSQKDCAITMDVSIKKNEADFVNTGARGDPTILRKEASTRILVADGSTTVVGGIYTRNTGLSYSKVPFFGDLPVVGWFFKKRKENDDRTELLVFITPKITNKASLRCE